MTSRKLFQNTIVSVACLGMLAPSAVFGAPPQELGRPTTTAFVDVQLKDGGILDGQVVDSHGNALGNAEVRVISGGSEVATVRTNEAGQFSAAGLRGGVVQLVTDNSIVPCRVWTGGTAPPTAHQQVLLVNETSVVRGQTYGGDDGVIGPIPQGGPVYGAGPEFGEGPGYVPGPGAYSDPQCCTGPQYGPPPVSPCRKFCGVIGSPLFIGGLIAVAIALPLALDDDDNGS